MKIWDEPLSFEWDEGNKNKNLRRHNVTDQDAEEVFSNEPLLIQSNKTSSDNELRYFALGRTDRFRLLYTVFTIRKKKIRIISAREMTKNEEKAYAKTK